VKHITFGEKFSEPICIALGFFDCMHKGHRKILSVAAAKAKQYGAKSALLTFENNFFSLLGRNEKLVYTFEERKSVLDNLSLDLLISTLFDERFMKMKSDIFFCEIAKYNIKSIICGFDYKFGSDKADAYKMQELAAKKGIDFYIQQPVSHDGIKISTSLVKKALIDKRIDLVNYYLEDKYMIQGAVVKGRGVGHTLGFPTANISINKDKLLPMGVFAGEVILFDHKYKALVNIGSQPTFDSDNVTIEAYIHGFDGDIYGQNVTLRLTKFIRDTVKFSSKKELIERLNKDISELND
jgi:riboflavin kinase/FMN adenylyltransferase